MGMIANYQESTKQELESIKTSADFVDVDAVEELQENNEPELCDIDKMWDALHFLLTGKSAKEPIDFLLTGKSASEPIENDPVSEAIVGQFNISGEEFEEYVSGTLAERVKVIAEALQGLDFNAYAEKFTMRSFAEHNIYPDLWSNEDEAEEILDYMRDCFESLKQFYLRMAEKGAAVLVSIF